MNRVYRVKLFKVGIILMILSCVSACGQKGPLYHPDKEKVPSSELRQH
ncbi:MAG: lipoprotein [Proteobacteria bacterium]|nr:lipoprotein [Pseudomonadota bacterium]